MSSDGVPMITATKFETRSHSYYSLGKTTVIIQIETTFRKSVRLGGGGQHRQSDGPYEQRSTCHTARTIPTVLDRTAQGMAKPSTESGTMKYLMWQSERSTYRTVTRAAVQQMGGEAMLSLPVIP